MRVKKEAPQAVQILKLARFFLAGERLSISQIARKLDVSKRTAYRYLDYLEEAELIVQKDNEKRYYWEDEES